MDEKERLILADIQNDVKALVSFMKDHQRALYGNGRPGLISRMTRAETILWVICGVSGIGLTAFLAS